MMPCKFSSILLVGAISAWFLCMPNQGIARETTVTDSIAPTDDLSLPFGAFAIGKKSPEHRITLTNTGNTSLPLPPLTLTGPGTNAFRLNLNAGTAPCGSFTNLSAGESCTITLSFIPDMTGIRTAFLNIGTSEEQIAFHDPATSGISLFSLTSKVVTPVTLPASGVDDFPTWSPGRGQIAFHRQINGFNYIYRVNVDGTGETFVTHKATEPDWAPDAQKIVMRDLQFGGLKIYDLSLNQISAVIGSSVSGEWNNPHWSPDNQKLVFHHASINIPFPHDIFTINADGSRSQLIANNGKTPTWSPAGQKIAFHNLSTQGISLIDIGGTPTLLTNPGSAEDTFPTWSPDEARLVFQRTTSTSLVKNELMIIGTNGSSESPLTLASNGEKVSGKTPSWSPSTQTAVTLTGTALASSANSPPSAPQLLSPTNGQTGLGTSVTLKWLTSSDPDGDTLTYALLFCETAQFQSDDCQPTLIAKTQQSTPPFSGMRFAGTGMLIVGFLYGLNRNTHQKIKTRRSLFFIFTAFFFISACGGSGGSSPNFSAGGEQGGTEIAQNTGPLKPNTSYQWQITADDGKGGKASSLIWRFTT